MLTIPMWVLLFLKKYPTSTSLTRVRAKTISAIKGISEDRAKEILDASKESVAAYRDEMTGLAIQHLSEELLILSEKIEVLKKSLTQYIQEHELVDRIVSIPGIAEWTAIGLIVELGDIRRFSRVEEVVAYAGLDPVYHQSGDGISYSKIFLLSP